MASRQTQKGSRFEYQIRDKLTEHSGHKWERTPMSGAGVIKGDLFCPTANYFYAFECKSFKDTVIQENLLSAKSNNIVGWWEQCCREAEHMRKQPALVFKKDRGKALIAVVEDIPELNCLSLRSDLGEVYIDFQIYLFDEWLASKLPEDIAV